MRLQELMRDLPPTVRGHKGHDREILGVELDSRRVEQDFVFASVASDPETAASHVRMAKSNGAAATFGVAGSDADYIVADGSVAAAHLAAAYYGYPSDSTTVIAVTGTNGKSSVTHTLSGMLRTLGSSVGSVGTIGTTLDGRPFGGEQRTPTTPESPYLQALLRRFVDGGAEYVVMEASSIALAENRLLGTSVDVGVFTNLTHDHLDAHGSMSAYEAAKLRLVDLSRAMVVNNDDPVGRKIARGPKGALTFAVDGPGDVRATQVRRRSGWSTEFDLEYLGDPAIAVVQGIGWIPVVNGLAALAVCAQLGIAKTDAVQALSRQPGPPGRLEVVESDKPFDIIIDYAHSPDSLAKLLEAVGEWTRGRIITVFGCGGDRDATKRGPMGAIAAEYSNIAIVTTDNPRTEDPSRIIDEICRGISPDADCEVNVIVDRSDAIRAAIECAAPGDAVVIAGKGSEAYQIVGAEKIAYSDQAAVAEVLGAGVAPPGVSRDPR